MSSINRGTQNHKNPKNKKTGDKKFPIFNCIYKICPKITILSN